MKKKRFYVVKIKSVLLNLPVLLLILLLVLRSDAAITAARRALVLCYQTVIPSLFPFFVLSGILTGSGFVRIFARLMSPVMRPLFRVDGAGALAFAIGILSGYPMGAKTTAELLHAGKITRTEAERLLPYCNNSGPLFIIGAVGTGMLGSAKIGVYLYVAHVICAALVGLCFRFFKPCEQIRSTGRAQRAGEGDGVLTLFSASVSGGVSAMLTVCGFIVLFAAITACISPFLDRFLPAPAALVVKGLMEVTNGAYLIALAGGASRWALSLTAFLVGFGGICVMMQVAGVISGTKIGLKSYLIGKTMHGALSAAAIFICYPFFGLDAQRVFAPVSPLYSGSRAAGLVIAVVAVCVLELAVLSNLDFKRRRTRNITEKKCS